MVSDTAVEGPCLLGWHMAQFPRCT